MSSQFTSRTGLPMIDLFFNGFATMVEMQQAFASGSMLRAPMSMNFGRSQPSRPIGIGAAEQQVIPIPKEELRIGKRQVPSAKAYRVSTTVVEVPVEEQVDLRAETVMIERRPTTGTTVRRVISKPHRRGPRNVRGAGDRQGRHSVRRGGHIQSIQ